MEAMSTSNQRALEVFSNKDVVQNYVQTTSLDAREQSLFVKWITADHVVLDVGVGAGRTVPALSERSLYVAIDFSRNMLRLAHTRFPTVSFVEADARAIPFRDESFDVVLFSFNGIDSLDDDERQVVLGEVRRVLKPQGLFIYSRHNARFLAKPEGNGGLRSILGALRRGIRHATSSSRLTMYVRGMGRYRDEIHGGIDYLAITPRRELRHLRQAGYRPLEILPSRSWARPTIPDFYFCAQQFDCTGSERPSSSSGFGSAHQ